MQLQQKMDAEVKELQERLATTQAEFETINDDRVASMNKLNELNKKLLVAQQEKEAAHRKYAKEVREWKSSNQLIKIYDL